MLCLLDAFDNILIQPFMPNRSVIALNIGILLRLSRLDMLDCNDPVNFCSGVIMRRDTGEHCHGRRRKEMDGAA